MIVQAYSLFDSKAKLFSQPFFALNDAVAKRMCHASAQGDSALAKNPEDYSLFHIGEFDDDKGLLFPAGQNVNVCLISSLLMKG